MNDVCTHERLLDEFLAEKRALGYSYKRHEYVVRRFLREFTMPADGKIEFTKEYVLENTRRRPNQGDNTVVGDTSAINIFLDFVIRKGFKAYLIPKKSLPKVRRNFIAHIFTEDEIAKILNAADSVPTTGNSPDRHYQLPTMFRILFNCGLRSSELLNIRIRDIDLSNGVLKVEKTKFYKSRFVPFSNVVKDAITDYIAKIKPLSEDDFLFFSSKTNTKMSKSGLQRHFRLLLGIAGIPWGGRGKGPRIHDIRHTFAVYCLNGWALSGVDLMAAVPVLSRYLGHIGILSTQVYLQLTSQMYPDIVGKMETKFGELIPVPYQNRQNTEVGHETA